MKKLVVLFLSVLALISGVVCVRATVDTPSLLGETKLPDNLNFSVNDTCSDHICFMQAAAQEDGCYALYTRKIVPGSLEENNFKQVYIDLYHADTFFYKELSFVTSEDFTLQYTNNQLIMYFDDHALIYDLDTETLSCWSLPIDPTGGNSRISQLLKKKFTSGSWEYQCTKSGDFFYNKLTRTNGDQVQTLFEKTQPGTLRWLFIFCAPIPIATIILVKWCRKQRDKKQREA